MGVAIPEIGAYTNINQGHRANHTSPVPFYNDANYANFPDQAVRQQEGWTSPPDTTNYADYPDQRIREFIDPYVREIAREARARHAREHGNVINYVAGIMEGKTYTDIFVDINRQVIEIPKSEVTAKESYDLDWIKTGSIWKFKMGERTLDEVYDSAAEDKTGQIPLFEKERNEINRENYHKLREARMSGERRTFVEFSPSPPMYIPGSDIQPEDRGYWGYDAWFFYTYEGNKEKVEQFWLPQIPMEDYERFFKEELKMQIDEKFEFTPSNIMRLSSFFDEQNIIRLRDFVHGWQQAVDSLKAGIIDEHGKTVVAKQIEQESFDYIEAAKQGLMEGWDISQILEDFADSLAESQAGFRLKIREVIGDFMGIRKTNLVFGSYNKMTYDQYRALSKKERSNLLKQSDYIFEFCGGRNKSKRRSQGNGNSLFSSPYDYFGRSDGIPRKPKGSEAKRDELVVCRGCGRVSTEFIDEDLSDTYIPECVCGEDWGCGNNS